MKIKNLFLGLISAVLLSGCDYVPPGEGEDPITPPVTPVDDLKEFVGVTFESKHFKYDGLFHSLEVVGAPEGTQIAYFSNSQKDVGQYSVQATLTLEGYKTKTLFATIFIDSNEFVGLSFNGATIEYDGKIHSLEVVGAPEGASITYTGNNQKDVGTYSVTAKVTMPGYKDKTLTATLIIKGKKMEGVKLESKEFQWDGYYHSLEVTGAPENAKITYTNNEKKSEGTYQVTATITAPGYESLTLSATMIISDKLVFPEIVYDDLLFIYDGQDFSFDNSFDDAESGLRLPYDTIRTVKLDGKETQNYKVKTVGKHTVEVKYECEDYISKTCSFIIDIRTSFASVDSTKTAYKLTKNQKYDDLYAEIMKGNFSVKLECSNEYDDDYDGIYERVIPGNHVVNFYKTQDAYFRTERQQEGFVNYETTIMNIDTKYAYTKEYSYGVLSEKNKMPIASFKETSTLWSRGMLPFGILKKGEDGGFVNSYLGSYAFEHGTYEIDTEKNQLIIWGRCYYNHEYEHYPNHAECNKYIFYNIGNTKIDLPNDLKETDKNKDKYDLDKFYINGIYYSLFHDDDNNPYFRASVSINECKDAYLRGGEFILPAKIEDIPILSIDYDTYYTSYRITYAYTFKVYFDDSTGYYKGEYESLGKVKYWKDIEKAPAKILYYDDWH